MSIQRVSPVLPADDLAAAVGWWRAALGVEPTLADGDRWVQFDVGGSRLALAGADRPFAQPSVMVKVDDLDAARARLRAHGMTVGALEDGHHERRFTAADATGWPVVFYASV